MSQLESNTKDCPSCCHFGFCMVYWETDCKRQGGTKIPRMKSDPNQINIRRDKKSSEEQKVAKTVPKPKKQNAMFEPIRTKVANW